MDFARNYLEKNTSGEYLITHSPEKSLKFIVVIPSYIETRLEDSLVSLFNADPPSCSSEILVVINWPEDDSPENINLSREQFSKLEKWAAQHSSDRKRFHIIEKGFIPRKKAGVGFARKTGMDEAVRRFLLSGQEDGIIISFDADTKCDKNYFQAIEEHFLLNPLKNGCSIYFEHPLNGNDFNPKVYNAITQYELHMRCYLHAIRHSGFPNAFYTVGSAFAIRNNAYCRQGGMNIRQAGEDFYFLQKFFDLGNFSDLVNTRVTPSPRPSLRVPFGTGKTIDQLIKTSEPLSSYNPEIFDILGRFFIIVPDLFRGSAPLIQNLLLSQHPVLLEFLNSTGFHIDLKKIQDNSSGDAAFRKRFFRYFNMFRILKFVKHARNFLPDQPVGVCALSIMQKTGISIREGMSEKDMLLQFRAKDKTVSGLQ